MSRKLNKVERDGFTDTKYASGDSNKTNKKNIYQEENNNIVDKLTEELSAMGCVANKEEKPNICVENCVHHDTESECEEHEDDDTRYRNDETHEKNVSHENGEDAYSDEFEDADSENEEIASADRTDDVVNKLPSRKNFAVKQSQSCTTTNKTSVSISGRSTAMSSISSSRSRRVNMSFTNNRLREIERQNHVLLNKIIGAKRDRKSAIKAKKESSSIPKPPAPAAFQRKQQQKKINYENLILLKKIQRVKSSSLSVRR